MHVAFENERNRVYLKGKWQIIILKHESND